MSIIFYEFGNIIYKKYFIDITFNTPSSILKLSGLVINLLVVTPIYVMSLKHKWEKWEIRSTEWRSLGLLTFNNTVFDVFAKSDTKCFFFFTKVLNPAAIFARLFLGEPEGIR